VLEAGRFFVSSDSMSLAAVHITSDGFRRKSKLETSHRNRNTGLQR